MSLYKITVRGCDDRTTVFKQIHSDYELIILENIANSITKTSTYSCMPTMEVTEVVTQDDFHEMVNTILNGEYDLTEFYFNTEEKEKVLEMRWQNDIINKFKNGKEYLEILHLELKPAEDLFSDDYVLIKTNGVSELIESFSKDNE